MSFKRKPKDQHVQKPIYNSSTTDFMLLWRVQVSVQNVQPSHVSEVSLLHISHHYSSCQREREPMSLHFLRTKKNNNNDAYLLLEYETCWIFVSRMAPEIRPVQNLQLSHAQHVANCSLVHAKIKSF